jgi:hypothetical protein
VDQVLTEHPAAQRPADEDRLSEACVVDDFLQLVRPATTFLIERGIERLADSP